MAPKRNRSGSSSKIDVKVVESDPAKDPVVVSFPGGVPAASSTPPQFVWTSVVEGSKRGRRVVGKDDTCTYQAENVGRGYDGRRTKLCVAVYNKRTKTLEVQLAAEKGTVYALTQSVSKYSSSGSALQTGAQRRAALFADFGSSKKQKVLRSQAANRVTVDSVIGANQMTGAFSNQSNMSASNRKALEDGKRGEKSNAIEVAYAEARQNFLPVFDADAKEPHLVYSARDMAGEDAWGRISRVADACLHKAPHVVDALTNRPGAVWHESVLSVLNSIPLESANAKLQLKTCILLNHMITFFQYKGSLRGEIKYIARDVKIPDQVCTRFLELFATPMGGMRFARSKQDLQKCTIHMLLLYLLAQGKTCKVGNFTPILEDLTPAVELQNAMNVMREAGCNVTKQGASNFSASLTVPLTFPAPKQRAGRM